MTPRDYLSSLEQFGIKLGLDQIRVLVEHLDRPDQSFNSIIVAGTNGKGSVTAMIERALRAAGLRTGRYISPHLVRLEERFVVDGVEAASDEVDGAIERVRAAAAHLPAPPSYFEATTAVALEIFRRRHIDIAVLEVGLGGRLDATNVVTPIAATITAIDLDHQQYLGDTIEAIAAEKAGVIKPGRPVVLGRNPQAAITVVRATAQRVGAPFVYAPDGVSTRDHLIDGRTMVTLTTPRASFPDVLLAFRGRHQVENAVTAVRLLETIELDVPHGAIRAGLEQAAWPARLELRTWRGGWVLIDGAHNPAGARALAAYLDEAYGRPLPMVVGVMGDKAVDEIIRALAPAASRFVFTAASSARAASPDSLVEAAARVAPGVPAIAGGRPLDALDAAADGDATVVVAGSLYLCGEIREGIS
jgi:dihydrofolate synthase/folylpolyglutamate synthase